MCVHKDFIKTLLIINMSWTKQDQKIKIKKDEKLRMEWSPPRLTAQLHMVDLMALIDI